MCWRQYCEQAEVVTFFFVLGAVVIFTCVNVTAATDRATACGSVAVPVAASRTLPSTS